MLHLIIPLIMDFHNGLWIMLTDPPHLKVDRSEVHPKALLVFAGREGNVRVLPGQAVSNKSAFL